MVKAAGTNSRKPSAISGAEAEALVAGLQIELPTAEQWADFVRNLVIATLNPVSGDANIRLRAWYEGLAVIKLVEPNPGYAGSGWPIRLDECLQRSKSSWQAGNPRC